MHRHGYKRRKLSRTRDPRRLLIKSLASDFIRHRSLITTLPKAKELLPYVERLITKAKRGGLHQRRQIIAKLGNIESAHLLVDSWAPQLTARNSGHLRLEKMSRRHGDGALLVRVAFVDQLLTEKEAPEAVAKKTPQAAKSDQGKGAKNTSPTKRSSSRNATTKPAKTTKKKAAS